MKKLVISLMVVSMLLSGLGFVLLPSVALAAQVQPVAQPETVHFDGGDPDNDHTPIYGPDGQLIYPIYDQGPGPRRAMAIAMASAEDGCLPTPVANGQLRCVGLGREAAYPAGQTNAWGDAYTILQVQIANDAFPQGASGTSGYSGYSGYSGA